MHSDARHYRLHSPHPTGALLAALPALHAVAVRTAARLV